jgi:hypothetical protein
VKRAVLVVLIAGACGGHQPPPPISSTGSGSGSASTATTASGPCGGQTCAPTDYCIETTVSGGMAPAPGDPPNISTSYSCGAPPPQSNAGRCSEPDAQRNIHCEYAAP